MPRYSLDDVLDAVLEDKTPKAVTRLRTYLQLEAAEKLCDILRRRHKWVVEPFDFPRTKRVWQESREGGEFYKWAATRQLIQTLAKEAKVDYRTIEGFREILPEITADVFKFHPINEWGTTLGGMIDIAYNSSPSAAVIDLVMNDPEFRVIAKAGLQPYDFPFVPRQTWTDEQRQPTPTARQITKRIIQVLAVEANADYRTIEGFKRILPELGVTAFFDKPINIWGTTLGVGMLAQAYKSSPSAAIIDLIGHDDEFAAIKRAGLQPYDFSMSPANTWMDEHGQPTRTARDATKLLIQLLAAEAKADYRTIEGFKAILPHLTFQIFLHRPINIWGTTLNGMIANAYRESPSEAVLDLIEHDDEFMSIRQAGLQQYDFLEAPRRTWMDEHGQPTPTARDATKLLVRVLAAEAEADYRTIEGFKAILPHLTFQTFVNHPINIWGTTLNGMIANAYRESPSEAVLDLIGHDDEFAAIREAGLQPYDFLRAPANTWMDEHGQPTPTAREMTKKLVQILAAEAGADYRTKAGFERLLSDLTTTSFERPINIWGTNLRASMLKNAYGGSPAAAVLDLVRNDPDFEYVRAGMNESLIINLTGGNSGKNI